MKNLTATSLGALACGITAGASPEVTSSEQPNDDYYQDDNDNQA
ncbi:hypothetical protein ACFL2Q_04630 [Thermodesulfobacteriota bacterium]